MEAESGAPLVDGGRGASVVEVLMGVVLCCSLCPGWTLIQPVTTLVLPARIVEPGPVKPFSPWVVPYAWSRPAPEPCLEDASPDVVRVVDPAEVTPPSCSPADVPPIWSTGGGEIESPVGPPRSSTTKATMMTTVTRTPVIRGTDKRRSQEVSNRTILPEQTLTDVSKGVRPHRFLRNSSHSSYETASLSRRYQNG